LTWPREGIPAGQAFLVAPAHPELGAPEVRIAVPDDPDGEAAALGEALGDPEIAAALRGNPDAPSIPADELYAELGYTPPEKRYSGKVRLRLPKRLHGLLAAQAQEEGVSLNTLMIAYLSERAAVAEGSKHPEDVTALAAALAAASPPKADQRTP
jgi:hypothetical protein